MFRLFNTPQWFNGIDIVFDSIMLVVALLIAAYSMYAYKKSGENGFSYFSLAFGLISFSFLFKILMQNLVYFATARNAASAVLVPIVGKAASGINFSELFFRGGFFLSMASMLGAWLLIFFISQRRSGRLKNYHDVSQIALFIYLIVLISVVSNFKFAVFYLTSAVILGMTVLNYYKNYLNTKNKNTLVVMFAFILLCFANVFFVFVFISQSFYVVGEVFMLIGFLSLLYMYRKIKRN